MQGPVAHPIEFKEAKEEKREWEDVTILRNKEEITEANKVWIKLHFKSSESKNQEKEDKISITSKEVREAMKIMGKGKAGATDNISDMIYTKKEWKRTSMNLKEFGIYINEEQIEVKWKSSCVPEWLSG